MLNRMTPWWPPSRRWTQLVTEGVPLILTASASYMILGGVWEGETASFAGVNPGIAYGVLAIAIVLIAGLEGLQISVSALSRKDLEEVRHYYPRAYNLHRDFKMDEAIVQRFFAGRQLLIVAIVFIASRFTAFPAMTEFPFTDISFPAVLLPWFDIIFLDLGLLGAIFVYWFGNLTSQLVATEHPVAFLNLPGLGLLYTTCLFVDRIRLPWPSKHLAAYFGGRITAAQGDDYPDRIPLSAEQKYRRELENDSGFGIARIAQTWAFRETELNIRYEVTYEIGREGISTIRDPHFSLPQGISPSRLDFTPVLERSNGDVGPEYLDADFTQQPVGNYTEFTLSATEPIGEFSVGDEITFVLNLAVEASAAAFTRDRIRLDHPTRDLQLVVEFDDDVYTLDSPWIRVKNPVHAQTEGPTPSDIIPLDLETPADGDAFAEYREAYPKQGSVFELEWNATPRTDRSPMKTPDAFRRLDLDD